MKKLSFTFLFLFNCYINAQTLDPYKFFPSSVGNVWEYSGSWGFRAELYKDSIDNYGFRHLFFKYNDELPPYATFKIDSINALIHYTSFSLNWRFYKLDAELNESWEVRPEEYPDRQRLEARVNAKYEDVYLGIETIIMEITYYELEWGDTVINEFSWPRFTMVLGYGIGEIMEIDEEGGGPLRILQGCIIDGDTIGTITSVIDLQSQLNSFELFQNYPNPFNSSTTIKFNISEPQNVKLSVYSLLGEEVAVLMNEYKSSGTYTINFNADKLASGIYMYSLSAGAHFLTKKLILLK